MWLRSFKLQSGRYGKPAAPQEVRHRKFPGSRVSSGPWLEPRQTTRVRGELTLIHSLELF